MRIESSLIRDLTSRLEMIETKYNYLSYLIRERYANEKLIQLEVMRIISIHPSVIEYLPERLYPESTAKCDFWFKTKGGTERWMEIKMQPTNYRKPTHAKAVTQGIDGIIGDMERLRKHTPKDFVNYILFALYPIYSDSHQYLRKHLDKISNAALTEVDEPDIEVTCRDGAFQVYLIRLPEKS